MRMHMQRLDIGIKFWITLILAIFAVCVLFGVDAGAKQAQTLTAVPSLSIPSTQSSFSLDELQAETNVPLSEGPRLTYIVEQGGDVIRLDGGQVLVIGWGDATIRILSDETIGYTAAQQVVDIHVIQSPKLICTASEIGETSIRFDVSMGSGSYSLNDLHNWSVQYRAHGAEEFQPVDLAWLQSAPFYFTLNGLQPATAYDLQIQAAVTDKLTGEELLLEQHMRVRTLSAGAGSIEGSVTCAALPGTGIDILLQDGGTLIAAQYGLPNGEGFTFSGVADGVYQVVASCGQYRTVKTVEVRDGTADMLDISLDGRNIAIEYASLDAPDILVDGLEELAENEAVPEDGGIVEYRLVCDYVNEYGKPQVWRQAADDTAAGMCLSVELYRATMDARGQLRSEDILQSDDVSVILALSESLQGMEGYQVLLEQAQGIKEVESSYDAGKLRFTVAGAGEYTIFYRDPAYVYSETLAPSPEQAASAPEPSVPEPTTPESGPEETEPIPASAQGRQGDTGMLLGAGVVLLVAVVALMVRRGRRPPATEPPQENDNAADDEGEEDIEASEELPGTTEEQKELAEESELEPEPEPEPEPEQKPALPNLPPVLYRRLTPWEENSFFDGIMERKELKVRYDHGEMEEEAFKEQERDILLRM